MSEKITIERNYGVDLLRMVTMYLIVLLHTFKPGGVLNETVPLSWNYQLSYFLYGMTYCSVNVYALISGYVGVGKKYKVANIVMIWLQVVFYTISITVIYKLVCGIPFTVDDLYNMFFPVMTERYWYFTAYICMHLFIPFVKDGIETMPKYKFKILIVLFTCMFSILPTIFVRDSFKVLYGFCGVWLLYMYILGAYIKLHGLFNGSSCLKLVVQYVFAITITWGWKFVMEYFTYEDLGEVNVSNLLLTYTSPTMVLAAVSLLVLFSRLNLHRYIISVVKVFAPTTFGVYLLHYNPVLRILFWNDEFGELANLSTIDLLFTMLTLALFVYSICSIIDLIRHMLFKAIKLREHIERLESKIICKISD